MRLAYVVAAFLAACSTDDAAVVDDPLVAEFEESAQGAPIDRARAHFSLGCTSDAEHWAQNAEAAGVESFEASYLVAASKAAAGELVAARDVVAIALDAAPPDAPGHIRSALIGLLVAIHLELGDAAGAEARLLKYEPALASAARAGAATSFESLPAPVHSIQYLAVLKDLEGDAETASALRRHFDFLTEDFLSSRAGGALRPADHWILASVGAGRLSEDEAAGRLRAAWTGGFRSSWPFNYGMHAAFYPYRESKAFADIFRDIESDVAKSRRAATGATQGDLADRGFNGMQVGKRECGGVLAGAKRQSAGRAIISQKMASTAKNAGKPNANQRR